MSDLLQRVRRWWFNNEPGVFNFDGRWVTRQQVHDYGGPAVALDACDVCQRCEWLSRLEQADRYEPHKCETAQVCRERCEHQGDERWTMYHQDHYFAAAGCDPELDAPTGALMLHEAASQHQWFWSRNCNDGMATFRQKVAYATQADTEVRMDNEDWSCYDWAWLVSKGEMELGPVPPVPLVMYCHDMWRGNKQAQLDHYRPEVILTPFPTSWRDNFNIPDECEVVFTPAVISPFFMRPNLDPAHKECDLLVIGALGSDFYAPRRELNTQLESLPAKFTVEHSHATGSKRARWFGPLDDGEHCYMNKWAEKLGKARFVIFGPCAGRAKEMLLIKYFECLASGAVPIMPMVQDMELVGLEPMVHYVPLYNVNNTVLAHMLERYEQFRYIAENAVAHYQAHAHDWIFGTFENVIGTVTGGKYPKRTL